MERKLPLEIYASVSGWPFWINVLIKTDGNMCMRLWEAKQLRLQLDEAIEYVERKEQLDHIREIQQLKEAQKANE